MERAATDTMSVATRAGTMPASTRGAQIQPGISTTENNVGNFYYLGNIRRFAGILFRNNLYPKIYPKTNRRYIYAALGRRVRSSTMPEVPPQMDDDKRSAARFRVSLPVDLQGRLGTTRDVSVTGVYFETDQDIAPGSELLISLEMRHQWPRSVVQLICKGRVVRVEKHDGKLGVAATIDAHGFRATESDALM